MNVADKPFAVQEMNLVMQMNPDARLEGLANEALSRLE